jgi:hypothetical protein
VLSFFQQSKELQHSVDALRLQAEELKHSVEQQKELVGISKETLDYERALSARREQEARLKRQPDFVINGVGGKSGSGSVMNRVQMSNVGAPVSKVEFQVDPPLFSGSFGFSAYWPKGENKTFEVSFNKIGPMSEVTLNIHFVDEDGFVGTHTFLIWAEEGRPFSIQSRRKN